MPILDIVKQKMEYVLVLMQVLGPLQLSNNKI